MESPKRKVCEYCHEGLSVTAYYRLRENCRASSNQRHTDTVLESSSDEEFAIQTSASSKSSDTDSSFCLDDASENDSDFKSRTDLDPSNPNESRLDDMELEDNDTSLTLSSSSSESDTTLIMTVTVTPIIRRMFNITQAL